MALFDRKPFQRAQRDGSRPDPVLEVRDLSLSYGEEDIVKHVGLSVHSGEILCIVGESGCGKSTLLKAIHGMEAVNVTGGCVCFEGKDLKGLSKRERRLLMGTGIGLIPQNPQGSFNPVRSLGSQMKETMRSHGLSFEPDEIPRTNGPAIGFRKKLCSRYPATESAPPKIIAESARGIRISQMILLAAESAGCCIRI